MVTPSERHELLARGRRVLERISTWTPLVSEDTLNTDSETWLRQVSDDNARAGVGVDPWDKRRLDMVAKLREMNQ